MSVRRQVYRDRDGIRRTKIWDDNDPDTFHILTEQDMEPILDAVARDREIMLNNGDMKVEYKIPAIVFEQACREEWDESDWKKWYRGEGQNFRVWQPRLFTGWRQ